MADTLSNPAASGQPTALTDQVFLYQAAADSWTSRRELADHLFRSVQSVWSASLCPMGKAAWLACPCSLAGSHCSRASHPIFIRLPSSLLSRRRQETPSCTHGGLGVGHAPCPGPLWHRRLALCSLNLRGSRPRAPGVRGLEKWLLRIHSAQTPPVSRPRVMGLDSRTLGIQFRLGTVPPLQRCSLLVRTPVAALWNTFPLPYVTCISFTHIRDYRHSDGEDGPPRTGRRSTWWRGDKGSDKSPPEAESDPAPGVRARD